MSKIQKVEVHLEFQGNNSGVITIQLSKMSDGMMYEYFTLALCLQVSGSLSEPDDLFSVASSISSQ